MASWTTDLVSHYITHSDAQSTLDSTESSNDATAQETNSDSRSAQETSATQQTSAAQDTHDRTVAAADSTFAQAVAPLNVAYQAALATAQRAFIVGQATAQRALDLGGTQATFNAAVLSLKQVLLTAQQSAVADFSSAEFPFEKADRTAQINADEELVLEVNRIDSEQQTAETDADKAQSDTEAQQRNADAVGQAVLDLSYTLWKASGLESTLTTLASAHPSAWATEQKAVADAEQTRTDATATALSTKDTAQANADSFEQVSLNAYRAMLEKQNSTAGLEARQRLTITARDKAIAELRQEDFRNQLFSYNARHPEDLTLLSTLPGSRPNAPTLTIAGQPGMDPYDGALASEMFSRGGNNVGLQLDTHVPLSSVDDVIVRTANVTKAPAQPEGFLSGLRWNMRVAAEAGQTSHSTQWHIENNPNEYVPGSEGTKWKDLRQATDSSASKGTGGELQLDLNSLYHVSDTIIDSLVKDHLAYSLTVDPNSKWSTVALPPYVVVVVPQYTLDGVFKSNLIFIQVQPTKHLQIGDGVGEFPDGPPYYRLLDITKDLSDDSATGRVSPEGIAKAYGARYQQALLDAKIDSTTQLLHMVPFGAAIDHYKKGETGEFLISIAGDAGMLLSLGGSVVLAAAARAGKAAGATATAGKIAFGVGVALESSAGVARAGQSVYHFSQGDNALAANEMGEAVLRLLGVSASVAMEVKAARAIPNAPGASVAIPRHVVGVSTASEATSVLQKLTTEVNQALAANPRLATTVLSRAELDAAINPKLARIQYGNAVERLVDNKIKADPTLRGLFKHVGGADNPDFIGQGAFQGLNFDITTPGQIGKHLSRPKYGQGLNVITYKRASWIR